MCQLILTTFTLFCGIFLFASIENESSSTFALYVVGLSGCVAIGLVFLSNIVTLLTEVKNENEDDGEGKSEDNDEDTEARTLVSEIHGFWIVLILIVHLVYMGTWIAFAINPTSGTQLLGVLILPMGAVLYVLSVFMKPLRRDKAYMRFLRAHLYQYAVIPQVRRRMGGAKRQPYLLQHD